MVDAVGLRMYIAGLATGYCRLLFCFCARGEGGVFDCGEWGDGDDVFDCDEA